MAHLVRCWCGKIYRCDIEHPLPKGCCRFMEPTHERNCPDELFHERPITTALFEKFSAPLFNDWYKQKLILDKFPIREILENNSLKRTL